MKTTYRLDYSGHVAYHRHLGVTELSSNGECDDHAVTLLVGLGYHRDDPDTLLAIAWLDTNADPLVVATATVDRDDEKWHWLDWTLAEIGLQPFPLEPWLAQALSHTLDISDADLAPGIQRFNALQARENEENAYQAAQTPNA